MARSIIYTGIAAVLMALVMSGCARTGPILVDVSYQIRAGVTPEETPKAVVEVAPFRDDRGKKDSVVGSLLKNDELLDLVVQGTISQRVTDSFKTALSVRDITVKDAPSQANKQDFVLTGEIKTFWVEAVSSFPRTKMTAKVDLRVIAEDPGGKKVLHSVNVSSSIEESSVRFSAGMAEKALSEALTAAINQIFTDEAFNKRFK